MKTVQQWCLLFAGVLAGAIGGYVFTHHEEWLSKHGGLLYPFVLVFILLVASALPFEKIKNNILLKISKLKPCKIGILNDMGWDEKRPYQQFATGTNVTIDEWKEQIINDAKKNGMKVKVRLLNSKENFYSYSAILNPYGGVYPEEDLAGAVILSKIFDYVSKGGMFVNVADVPGYWAYSTKLARKSVAGLPVRYVKEDSKGAYIGSITPVAFAPFVQKLWLNVNPYEEEANIQWKDPVKHGTERFQQEISNLRINRIAVVERNVVPVLTLMDEKSADGSELTPLFLAIYDNGRFLISLIYQDSEKNSNNQKMKEVISIVLIQSIKGR
jgi:hypothetical protein